MNDSPAQKNINLLNRLTTAEIRNLEFTNDKGELLKYKRLVLAGEINGENLEVDIKVDKKDLTLISLFALIEKNILTEGNE